jgi:hypothetical protein
MQVLAVDYRAARSASARYAGLSVHPLSWRRGRLGLPGSSPWLRHARVGGG